MQIIEHTATPVTLPIYTSIWLFIQVVFYTYKIPRMANCCADDRASGYSHEHALPKKWTCVSSTSYFYELYEIVEEHNGELIIKNNGDLQIVSEITFKPDTINTEKIITNIRNRQWCAKIFLRNNI